MAAAAFAQPRIDSVSPANGPIAGGTLVTLRGAGLAHATISIDGHPAVPVARADGEVRLMMPPHDNGYAVLSAAAEGSIAYARFLYVPPPLAELPAGFITTIAGIGASSGEYGPAGDAFLRQPWALAFDRTGILYISDAPANRVWRVRGGILEPFVGNGLSGGTKPAGTAPALEVPIDFPRSVAFDNAGNLVVPDSGHYLWRVSPTGSTQAIAGNGQMNPGAPEGGSAAGSSTGFPTYVAVDAGDNIFYIDWAHARVRRIDAAGIVTTFAGTGSYGFSGDGGIATNAQFDLPFNDLGGLAVDAAGNLYLLDVGNRRIRKITRTTNVIETVVGPSVDGLSLDNLLAMAVTPDGTLYFSNFNRIFRRDVSGAITPLSSGRSGFSEDGTLLSEAALGPVQGLTVDADRRLVFVDNQRVRVVDADGRIRTLAGIGPRALGEGAAAIAAALTTQNVDLDLLPSGDLLIADHQRLYVIGSDGRLVKIGGSGTIGPIQDVPALQASLSLTSASARADGAIDMAALNLGVFRIDPDNFVRRTAGSTFTCGFAGDGGPALDAALCQVWDALADDSGNVLIADTNNNRIRLVDRTNGLITTIAGSGPSNGLERYGAGATCGDGGPAAAACINTPYGITFDNAGNLFVCENQSRIRRVTPAGTISTLAEVGCTKLTWAFGNLFSVAKDFVARVSTNGEITALTSRNLGFSGDGGPAADARIFALKQSHGVAVDAEGNLYFSDGDNFRIRAIRFGALLAPPGSSLQATTENSSIAATVRNTRGDGVPGVRVDFETPATGASCTPAQSWAITGADGRVQVTCTPNCVEGAYDVVVRALGSSAATRVTLTNSSRPCRRRSVRH